MGTNVVWAPTQRATAETSAGGPFEQTGNALLQVLVGVGDHLGLFKDLAANGAATAPELARRTGLNEGLVCEWLRAIALAGHLEHDALTRRFALPAGHPFPCD